MAGRFCLGASLALVVVAASIVFSRTAQSEPISIRTSPVSLSNGDPDESSVGDLNFLGGLWLRSPAKGFGGFSGLHISPDGKKLLAVSDMGYWLEADLVHGRYGALKDMRNVRLSSMLGIDGRTLTGKARGDAEGLTVTDNGIIVSFERRHRLWLYPLTNDLSKAVPVALPVPDDISSIEPNKGLEGITRLPGGRLLLLTEHSLDDEGKIRGWLGTADGNSYFPLRVQPAPPFAVTDVVLLPGDRSLLMLERRFSRLGGLGIKLRRIAVDDIKPGALLTGQDVAEFEPGQNIDNFEGLATRTDRNGHTMVYLLSDDNFNGFQRTLLLHFRLEDRATAARP